MSPSWPRDPLTRWSRRALRLAAKCVPSGHRVDWLAEWEAELWQLRTRRRGGVALALFLSGAAWHGVWEWKEGLGMDSMRQEIKVAVRTLARSPGFTGVALLVLGLSIGATTALFSVLEEAVIAEPPFPEPDRLVVIDLLFSQDGSEPNPSQWSYPRYEALREEVRSLDRTAGYDLRTMTLTELGNAALVSVETVTPSLLPLLGVDPVLGRVFGPGEEDDGSADRVALVSHAFWQSRLGGAPDAVGSTLTLDRTRFRLLGVLPPGFEGVTGGADVWIPMSALREVGQASMLEDPWDHHFFVLGRLADGISLETARSEVAAFGATQMERFPPPVGATRLTTSADVVPFAEARMNPVAATSLMALMGAVALVLMIAVANLAGLLLARGAARRREAAIRASLGAGRGRLMRQLLTESLVLAGGGGVLGLLLAALGIDALGVWLADTLGTGGGRGLQYIDTDALAIDWTVLAFAFLLTAVVGLGFGLLPAWQAARTDPNDALTPAPGASGLHGRPGGALGRHGLIVLQVSVAMMLLAGATLMMRGLVDLQHVDPGYDGERMLTATYSLSFTDERAGLDPALVHAEFLDRLRALPGVVGATLGEVPLGGPRQRRIVLGSDGRPELTPAEHITLRVQAVADGHASILGVPILEGRDIAPTDGSDTEKVVVLGRSAAAELFPDGRAIGQRLRFSLPGYASPGAVVVGIVEDVQLDGPMGHVGRQAYVAVRQTPPLETGVMVRTVGDPDALVPALRSALASVAPSVVLTSVMSMKDRARTTTARPRVVTALLALFGAVSLVLVAAGLYGAIAFSVARRTRELGLRASLGASRTSILALVLRQGLGVTLVGIAVGLLGSRWAIPYLEGLLTGAGTADAVSLAGASLVLLGVSLAATIVPARRALRVDPMEALRTD